MPSLASRSRAHVPPPQLLDNAFDEEGGLFDRLQALASAMRAIDPNLGPNLRAYRRRMGDDPAASSPFRLVFTHDGVSSAAEAVISNPTNAEFFETLESLFGDSFATRERQSLFRRIPLTNGKPQGNGRVVDAALQEAFSDGIMDAPVERGVGNGVTYAITDVVEVPKEAFLQSPDLTTIVLVSSPSPDDSMDDPLVRMRTRFSRVRELLSQPFETTNPIQRQEVIQTIQDLNRLSEDGSFEETMHHGWLGFSYAQGLRAGKPLGWTAFLVSQAQASPYAFYGEFSPLTLATAANDGASVQELLRYGVSPSTVMRGWPDIFEGIQQAKINELGGNHIPVVVYAAAVGSTAALGSLLQGGADPNHATDRHETALHRAAALGDDLAIRQLLQAGASANNLDQRGRRPDRLVPEGRLTDSLKRLLSSSAAAEMGEVNGRLDKEVASTQKPLAPTTLPQAREIWSSQRGPGRR